MANRIDRFRTSESERCCIVTSRHVTSRHHQHSTRTKSRPPTPTYHRHHKHPPPLPPSPTTTVPHTSKATDFNRHNTTTTAAANGIINAPPAPAWHGIQQKPSLAHLSPCPSRGCCRCCRSDTHRPRSAGLPASRCRSRCWRSCRQSRGRCSGGTPGLLLLFLGPELLELLEGVGDADARVLADDEL